MALINKDSILSDIMRYLKTCECNTGLELMSYKRNRWVAITSLGNKLYAVREKGYVDEELEINYPQLEKHLKKLIKREFPRSRKIRIFKFSDPVQLDRHHQKI